MRYFKNAHGQEWRVSDSGHIQIREWEPSEYKSVGDIAPFATETDAAGNPLGKYRYFRADCDDIRRNSQWRCSGSGSVEIRIDGNPNWRPSLHDRVEYLLNQQGAYECDEQGNRLNEPWTPVAGYTVPKPSPAPMSEEDRFRWQFAGQAPEMPEWFPRTCPDMQSMSARDALEHSNADALWRVTWADVLIAALKKPKATENGGGR